MTHVTAFEGPFRRRPVDSLVWHSMRLLSKITSKKMDSLSFLSTPGPVARSRLPSSDLYCFLDYAVEVVNLQ